MSNDLVWILTKRNNAFLVKRGGRYFSTAPNSATNFSSYGSSGLANSGSIGIGVDGKNVVLTQRATGSRSFNFKVTNLTRLDGKPAKLKPQAAAIIAAGSKKFAAAALEKWSRLTQAARSTPRHRRARDGPRAQKRAAAAAADEEDEE